MGTELVLISGKRPSFVWLLLFGMISDNNLPGIGYFFGTRVPGTRLTSLIMYIIINSKHAMTVDGKHAE